MIVSMQNLGSRPVVVTETLDGPALDPAILSPVAVELSLRLEAGLLRVAGRLSYRAKGECVRCLEPVEAPVDSAFETQIDLVEGKLYAVDLELEEDESEGSFLRLENGDVDLRGELESRILQSIPARFLCRTDCPGIPYAEKETEGDEEDSSNPFAKLSALLNEEKEK